MSSSWVPSPNFWPGRPFGPPVAIVLHTMAGAIGGCDRWFGNPGSQVSAHYGVSLSGEIHAYVRTGDRAWANGLVEAGSEWSTYGQGNPNHTTVSIETEDLGDGDQLVTDEQYAAVRTLVRTLHARYGQLPIIGHDQISPVTRPNCPGHRWRDDRFGQLVDETA